MPPFRPSLLIGLLGLICCTAIHSGAATATLIGQSVSAPGDLSKFKTTETAATIRIDDLRNVTTSRMSFLGITCATNAQGDLVVNGVAPGSPAAKAGVKIADVILQFGGRDVASPDALRALIESIVPDQSIKISLRRDNETAELMVKLAPLGAVGRPMERIRLGVAVGNPLPNGGVSVTDVDTGSTGASAGLKTGDVILSVNGEPIMETNRLSDFLETLPAEATAALTVDHAGQGISIRVPLSPPGGPDRPAANFAFRAGFGPRGYNARAKRDVLRIAIVGLEFPDVRHNPRIAAADWEQAFFSAKSYLGRSVTGQSVHGSINDFYQEQSSGTMRIEGKMLDWIQMSKRRADYSTPPAANGQSSVGGNFQRFAGDGPLLNEALSKLSAHEGRNVFSDYDGIFFIYAGGVATKNDTDVFWPHTAIANFEDRRVRFSISFEGGDRMSDISILCHELGHILGLPDLYVRPPQNLASSRGTPPTGGAISGTVTPPRGANPYAETAANWDLMAVQAGNGRPEHMSAWSKEQLGFIKPVVIDPRVPQQLILNPIENSTNQCLKIPLRPDGSEYFLLENRRHIGFDQSLPAEGLLIWRVVYGRPVLEEAHGYTGANAASISQQRIPYPTDRNNSFTPFSKPSSAAYTGDELPVYITNIRRLVDGRITLSIGSGYM